LSEIFGQADEIINSPSPSDLTDKKGIVIFDIPFSDATGHATLVSALALRLMPKYLLLLKNG